MYGPETVSRLNLLRQKTADNTITDEELKEATDLLRAHRRSATENAAKRRVVAKKSVKTADDLLAELANLP